MFTVAVAVSSTVLSPYSPVTVAVLVNSPSTVPTIVAKAMIVSPGANMVLGRLMPSILSSVSWIFVNVTFPVFVIVYVYLIVSFNLADFWDATFVSNIEGCAGTEMFTVAESRISFPPR